MRGELDFSPAEKWVVPKLGFSPGDPQASAKAQIYRDADVARLESLAPPTESRGLPPRQTKRCGLPPRQTKRCGLSLRRCQKVGGFHEVWGLLQGGKLSASFHQRRP